MNQLRQLMHEELHRCNFGDTTIHSALQGVAHFSRYFHRRPISLARRTFASIRRCVGARAVVRIRTKFIQVSNLKNVLRIGTAEHTSAPVQPNEEAIRDC